MTQNAKQPESLSNLSTSQMLVKYLIGDCTIPRSGFPEVNWLTVDGNIFPIIGTAAKAWRRVDSGVSERISNMMKLAMGNVAEDNALLKQIAARMEEAEAKRSGNGYSTLLGACMDVCPLPEDAEADECEEEEEDEEDEDDDC